MSIEKGPGGRTGVALAVGLLCVFALSQGLQAAGKSAGAKVDLVTGPGAERLSGKVIGVRADALVLEIAPGDARTVAIKDISSIRVHRKSAFLTGFAVGAVATAGTAFVISSTEYKDVWMGGIGIVAWTAGGAAGGGLLGGLIGSSQRMKTYNLAAMSAVDVDKLLAKLRKKARVKDYQ
jgi:hypothetical protein